MPTPITLKEILRNEARTTYEIAEKLVRRVGDDDLSWTPPAGKNWMTVGQLLMHCACFGCGKAVQGFVTGNWGPAGIGVADEPDDLEHIPSQEKLPSVSSVEEAVRLLADDRRLALHCIDETKEEALLTSRYVAPWGGPEMSLFQHLSLMIDHLGQHKGQLFYYLKLMGKDVGTADLWGTGA